MPQISSPDRASELCSRASAAYAQWVEAYSKSIESSGCDQIYRIDGYDVGIKPVSPFGRLSGRCGLGRAIWHGLFSFTFFPDTDVLPNHPNLPSNEASLLSDWAITGLDLYHAGQRCKIHPPDDTSGKPQSARE